MVTFNPGDTVHTASEVTTTRGIVHETGTPALVRGGVGVSWGAIIAGALTALSLLVLSSCLAFACGVPAYQGGEYGWGAGFWAVISSVIAFFCGGMLAAYLAGRGDGMLGMVDGFLTWALAVPLILLLTGFGGFRTLVGANVLHMSVQAPMNQPTWHLETGAAWGTFIAMLLGVIFAIVGGRLALRSMGVLFGRVR